MSSSQPLRGTAVRPRAGIFRCEWERQSEKGTRAVMRHIIMESLKQARCRRRRVPLMLFMPPPPLFARLSRVRGPVACTRWAAG